MRNQKNITDRKKLKEFFKKGNLPGESAFEKLIDSTFNIADDKLDINKDGLMIYPSENGKEKLLSFFEDRDNTDATWVMFISKKKVGGGISISQIEQSKNDDNPTEENALPPALFIQKDNGKVGLGIDLPRQQLDVNGLIASNGRMGTLLEKQVNADGVWHNVFDTREGLNGCHAYEIMAYAEGSKEESKYALMHAIAISTYGNSKPKITKTSAYQGKRWNKIDIRWEARESRISEEADRNKKKGFSITGWIKSLVGWLEQKDNKRYNLQVRTRSNYGNDKKLHYRVSELWNSDFIVTEK